MKYCFILLLCLPLLSGANLYKRGELECEDFSYAEREYKQNSENISAQVLYASCLVIKGEDTNGLARLYHLSDHQSSVTASFFLAEYLETDGRFERPISDKHLDEAIKYYFRALALIKLIPTYPEPDYWSYERSDQIELSSVYSVPYLYAVKYALGLTGAHCRQTLQYGHKEDCLTYPKYSPYTLDSLSQVVRYATECANLPNKKHFKPAHYTAFKQSCPLLKEMALAIIPLEEKRQELARQDHCKDLNESRCPEYYETRQKIHDLMDNFLAEEGKIMQEAKQNQ